MMLKIAFAGVAALMLVTIAIGRSPAPVVAAKLDQALFDEQWRDAAMLLVFNSAALASIIATKIVQVETVD